MTIPKDWVDPELGASQGPKDRSDPFPCWHRIGKKKQVSIKDDTD